MAKITRATQKPFGTGAAAGQMAQFGSLSAGTPVVDSGATITPAIVQALSEFTDGWVSALIADNAPAVEDMNGLCFLFAYQLGYLLQTGIPEWDSGTTYYIGSIANDGNGVLYTSLTNANLNNALTDTTNWAPKGGAVPKSANFSVSSPIGYLVDVSGGNVTASLPAASGAANWLVQFKNKSFGSANNLLIAPNGANNIEGSNTSVTVGAGEFVQLFCDGSAWYLWNV